MQCTSSIPNPLRPQPPRPPNHTLPTPHCLPPFPLRAPPHPNKPPNLLSPHPYQALTHCLATTAVAPAAVAAVRNSTITHSPCLSRALALVTPARALLRLWCT
mmetsp:Transcript_23262/g.64284  ORF Transcript_23262/g.64284 Transcript_23262/m.64284 type:complete len:103 (+) Transcript_23262:937-1245(+)